MKHVNSKDPRKPTIVAALRTKAKGAENLHAGRVTNVAETADGGFTGCVFLKRPGERGYGSVHRTNLSLDEYTAANRTRIQDGVASQAQLHQERSAEAQR